MIGRRVQAVEEVSQPGDYCGPIKGYTGDKPAVFFRLPIENATDSRAALRHVSSPPHRFRECPDGSVEIRESIGAIGWAHEPEFKEGRYVWHGYLDEGHIWREV